MLVGSTRFMVALTAVVLMMISLPGLCSGQTPEISLQEQARLQTAAILQGGSSWPVLETDFFFIHYQSATPPDSIACLELDRFVRETITIVNMPEATIRDLQEHKLSYYLCDDETITEITGYPTKGMADLAGRSVISSHFPHFHELAHLLVDMTFEESPSQTLPIVQEGIACLIGGRWGRAPATILYSGWVHHNFGMGELISILTRDGFYSCEGGTDVAYSLGTMMCEAVRRQSGWAGVMELNRRVSGSASKVATLDLNNIISIIADITGWPDSVAGIRKAVETATGDFRRCGIAPLDYLPEHEDIGRVISENGEMTLWAEGDRGFVQVSAEAFPVYFVSQAIPAKRSSSSVFQGHFPGQVYRGQRYGLRCSSNDIALYDYAANQLIATWVAGFTDEAGACENENGKLMFEVSTDLLFVLLLFQSR